MSDELDRHVLKKYDIQQKLGKGVSFFSIPNCAFSHLVFAAPATP